MKGSKYNFYIEYGNELYVYNSLSNVLIKLDYEKAKQVKAECFLEFSDEEICFLSDNGVLVEDDFDEMIILKERNLRGKYSNDILALTIVPSLLCNFECIYCYQEPNQVVMSEETENDIVEFIKNVVTDTKEVAITWFGGEPLLQIDLIERVSKEIISICKEAGVTYSASIITNGYLIDEKMVNRLKKINIMDAQITLDGPADIHNLRRKHKSDSVSTYDRCVKAISILKDSGIETNIRINLDRRNIDKIDALFADLNKKGIYGINVSLEKVSEFTSSCADTNNNYFTTEEMSVIVPRLTEGLIENRLYVDEDDFYPRLKYNYCGACQLRSITIGPKGELYKCWCDLGNESKSFSNIKDYDIHDDLHMKERSYMSYDPFLYSKCVDCRLMPLCMGGCPRSSLNGEVNCIINEEYLTDKIKKYLKVVERADD